jgi:BASS family bile acid:Na+ symporter
MNGPAQGLDRLGSLLHRHFLALLLATYALASAWPGPGAAARNVTVCRVLVSGQHVAVSLPMLLLAALLLNAGLGSDAAELAKVVRRPGVVLAGLAANLLLPVGFLFALFGVLRSWHNHEEMQNLLVGLAIVAAMPVAGSSTAWSQNAGGNVSLSLGLVVLSTVLSPWTTPLTLLACETLLTGTQAGALRELGGRQTGTFLLLCVLLPSLAGLLLRAHLDGERVARFKPALRLVNSLVLLFLCYANASTSLPHIVAEPDWDFLAMVVAVVAGLCLAAFAAGWLLARLLAVGEAQRWSLMFGLGMNNNGTGMVLASASLAALPDAVLPVLTYNLVQHLVAGGVNWCAARRVVNMGYGSAAEND